MLRETIDAELKSALRERNELRLSVFRLLSAALHNREIEKRTKSGDATLSEYEIGDAVRAELKKRRDAVAAYSAAGRTDAAAREEAEAEILSALLPPELTDGEIGAIVGDGMQTLGISSEKEFGKLMGWVMQRARGQASGDRVSAIIRERLRGQG